MTTIKDSVHDHIVVEGVAADLLDTPAVQRLRRIRQLGTVGLVYPSANHTRFEHSLGVYHLARNALDHPATEFCGIFILRSRQFDLFEFMADFISDCAFVEFCIFP